MGVEGIGILRQILSYLEYLLSSLCWLPFKKSKKIYKSFLSKEVTAHDAADADNTTAETEQEILSRRVQLMTAPLPHQGVRTS